MSYIQKILEGKQSDIEITDFLLNEGFKYGTGAQGEGIMYYVASSDLYSVWFALCEDYISLYVEYNVGGHICSNICYFRKNDFNSFIAAYKNAVNWAKDFM